MQLPYGKESRWREMHEIELQLKNNMIKDYALQLCLCIFKERERKMVGEIGVCLVVRTHQTFP